MPPLDTAVIVLAGIAFLAAFVNGALGYGFSSLTVPVALVFYANRILNPAVVLVEVATNFYVLFINLNGVAAVWKRVFPIITGLLPGIGIGALVLTTLQPGWIKLGTYALILPLILVQAAGWRRPVRQTWWVGLPFGTALGILYSVTTISGPPLAILFNNQGLVKTEFRAGLALVRVAESSVTAIVYYQLGLFTAESGHILWVFVPCVVVGVPLGAFVIRRLDPETFRRICMSFDAWVVGFGFSRVLIELNLVQSPWAYVVLVLTFLIDGYLLYIFFTRTSLRPACSAQHRPRLRCGDPRYRHAGLCSFASKSLAIESGMPLSPELNQRGSGGTAPTRLGREECLLGDGDGSFATEPASPARYLMSALLRKRPTYARQRNDAKGHVRTHAQQAELFPWSVLRT